MDFVNSMMSFLFGFIDNVGKIATWFVTKHDYGLYSFTPIYLLGISGLIAYLGVAVTKWIIS